MIDLYKANTRRRDVQQAEITISRYLPLYDGWTFMVVFVFPLIFGFKNNIM
jgi:hypothetical protein